LSTPDAIGLRQVIDAAETEIVAAPGILLAGVARPIISFMRQYFFHDSPQLSDGSLPSAPTPHRHFN